MEEENLLKILLVPAQLLEQGFLPEPEYTSPFILSAALGFPTLETVNTVDKLKNHTLHCLTPSVTPQNQDALDACLKSFPPRRVFLALDRRKLSPTPVFVLMSYSLLCLSGAEIARHGEGHPMQPPPCAY